MAERPSRCEAWVPGPTWAQLFFSQPAYGISSAARDGALLARSSSCLRRKSRIAKIIARSNVALMATAFYFLKREILLPIAVDYHAGIWLTLTLEAHRTDPGVSIGLALCLGIVLSVGLALSFGICNRRHSHHG